MHLLVPAAEPLADPLDPYAAADRTPRTSGCWVLSNMVIGLDGTAAVRGRVGPLSTGRDAELFLALRALADVVLVGAETVRRERYGPVRLDAGQTARRNGRPPPTIAVVSASLDLEPDLPLFAHADPMRPPLVLTTARSDVSQLAGVPAEIVIVGKDRVDLATALSELARRSVRVVLCEGGPTLLGGLVAGDLLDEYCLTIAPIIGGDPLPAVNTTILDRLTHFRLVHAAEEDHTLFLRYVRREHP
jgi:riboflavin biosynthesis pyrimidine reductase